MVLAGIGLYDNQYPLSAPSLNMQLGRCLGSEVRHRGGARLLGPVGLVCTFRIICCVFVSTEFRKSYTKYFSARS
jgi:hypothetical protein